jgi:hypothetical protein
MFQILIISLTKTATNATEVHVRQKTAKKVYTMTYVTVYKKNSSRKMEQEDESSDNFFKRHTPFTTRRLFCRSVRSASPVV